MDELLGHVGVTLISLLFLAILGGIAGVAIPGLFMPLVAPLLEKILSSRKR